MPRYDYRCTGDCGRVCEVTHGMSESPEVTCPTCGADMQRVFVPQNVVYKGNGFYTTDNRRILRQSDVL